MTTATAQTPGLDAQYAELMETVYSCERAARRQEEKR